MADLAALFQRIDAFKIGEIAKASKLSRAAIINIRRGETENPGILTLEKLDAALRELESTAATKTKGSRKADDKQTPSRDKSTLDAAG